MKKVNKSRAYPTKQGSGRRNLKKLKVPNKDIMSPPPPLDDMMKVQDYLNQKVTNEPMARNQLVTHSKD